MLGEFQLFSWVNFSWVNFSSHFSAGWISAHTNVGSAWPELVANSLLCKIEKSLDDRKLTYLQVTQKWSCWRVESAPTRAYV